MRTQIDYVCVLANAHSSLTALPLEHELKFECLPHGEFIELLALARGLPQTEIFSQLFARNVFKPNDGSSSLKAGEKYSDTYSVIIRSSFTAEIDFHDNGTYTPSRSWGTSIYRLSSYIDSLLQKLRLYKDGNICRICEFQRANGPQGKKGMGYCSRVGGEVGGLYKINSEEVHSISSFVENFSLPSYDAAPEKKIRGIATSHENFELSFKIPQTKASFILLITALENLVTTVFGDPKTFLKGRLKADLYRDFEGQFVSFLNQWDFEKEETNRLKNRLLSTCERSMSSHVYSYFSSLGIIEFTEDDIKLWYKFRNHLAHGNSVDIEKLQVELERIRSALRSALKQEILYASRI